MKQHSNKPVIYLPAIHQQLIYDDLPAEVLLINPGLPQTTPKPAAQGAKPDQIASEPVKRFTSPNLIFAPRAAEACLRDLLEFEETVQDLSAAAALKIVDKFWGALSPLENKDLIHFIENAGNLEASKLANLRHEIEQNIDLLYKELFEQGQKNLLLAWSHEENIISIAELLLKAGKSTGELRANIKDPLQDSDFFQTRGHAQDLNSPPLPAQRYTQAQNLQKPALDLHSAEHELPTQLPIDLLITEIMQESGLTSSDLQPEWSAALIGALCLTEPDTLFYTTETELTLLLNDICPNEENLPTTMPLPSEQAQQLFPEAAKTNNFVMCKIPYKVISAAYTSPLLKRLMWLEQDKRQEVIFIYKS